MKRKIILLILVTCMVFSLVGCYSREKEEVSDLVKERVTTFLEGDEISVRKIAPNTEIKFTVESVQKIDKDTYFLKLHVDFETENNSNAYGDLEYKITKIKDEVEEYFDIKCTDAYYDF